jgi:hypothetical protein
MSGSNVTQYAAYYNTLSSLTLPIDVCMQLSNTDVKTINDRHVMHVHSKGTSNSAALVTMCKNKTPRSGLKQDKDCYLTRV